MHAIQSTGTLPIHHQELWRETEDERASEQRILPRDAVVEAGSPALECRALIGRGQALSVAISGTHCLFGLALTPESGELMPYKLAGHVDDNILVMRVDIRMIG